MEGMLSLADLASQNVFAQLQLDDPTLAEEIKSVIHGEIRRVEIELSIMLTDLKKSYDDDIAALKAQGKSLPADHDLTPLDTGLVDQTNLKDCDCAV
jgi:hypothetical protein